MENKLVCIRDFLLEKEKELELFDLKYNNVYIYKLIRVPLFEKIQFATNALDSKFGCQRSKIKKFFRIVFYSLKNMFKPLKSASVLYLSHGRKILVDGNWIDVYLDEEIQKDKADGKKIYLIDRPSPEGRHLGYSYIEKRYYEHFDIIKRELFWKFFKFKNNYQTIADKFDCFTNEIFEKFHVKIDINILVKEHYYRFIHEKEYFKKILKKVKPKELKLVVAYGKEELIAAAHELNINVTEFQHGLINRFHFAYHFPNVAKIPYFPDNLALFGQYWLENISIPKCVNIIYYKNILINEALKKLKTVIKEKNKVVFLSSCDSNELQNIALDFCNKNKEYKVFYKFHPTEFPVWKIDYPKLLDASIVGKISIVPSNMSVQDAIIDSEFVVATSSTAVYEAIMLNCKVFIAKIGGYIWLQDLLDCNYVQFINQDCSLRSNTNSLSEENKEKMYIRINQ